MRRKIGWEVVVKPMMRGWDISMIESSVVTWTRTIIAHRWRRWRGVMMVIIIESRWRTATMRVRVIMMVSRRWRW